MRLNAKGFEMHTKKERDQVVPGAEFLRRLVLIAPHDLELRLRYARKLFEGDQLGDALWEIREVILRDPNNLAARELLEVVYDQLPDHTCDPRPEGERKDLLQHAPG